MWVDEESADFEQKMEFMQGRQKYKERVFLCMGAVIAILTVLLFALFLIYRLYADTKLEVDDLWLRESATLDPLDER